MTEIEMLDAIDAATKARRQTLAAPPAVVIPDRLRALGVFSPLSAAGVKLAEYVQWLGRTPSFVADNCNETGDWQAALSSVWYMAKSYKATPATIVLGVPLLPKANSGQFVAGAKGDFDGTILAMAKSLKSLIDRDVNGTIYTVVIRLGWEFNGDWMPWFAGKDSANYKLYYRRFVNLFRSVDARFKFDWCATLGTMNVNTFACYPGDDVVDIIGADVYDEAWSPVHRTDVKARFSQRFVGGDQGLVAFRKFAVEHNKLLSFPEWGCRNRAAHDTPAANGGDNPYFIEQMALHFDSLKDQLAYHCYFERADVYSSLSVGVKGGPTLFPNAAATFRRLFGG